MIAREFVVRPRVDPDHTLTPHARLLHGDHFRRWNSGSPRNFVSKMDRLYEPGNQRKRRENQRLAQKCLHHLLSGRSHHARRSLKFFRRIVWLNRQDRSDRPVRFLWLDADFELARAGLLNLWLKIRTR